MKFYFSPSFFIRLLKTLSLVSLFFLLLIACSGPPVASDVSLISNPNKNAPLAGILSFTSDRPVVVTLQIDDGKKQQTVTPDEDYKTDHTIPVLGLRPGRVHTITVTIKDESDKENVLEPLTIETPSLPEDFPPIQLTDGLSGNLEPGITMINMFRWDSIGVDDKNWGLNVAVDQDGEVVWYLQSDFGIDEARRKPNGNLIFGGKLDGRLFEVDMLGNFINEWHSKGVVLDDLAEGSIPVDTDCFHHDVIELGSGNFIGLGLEVKSFDDFPIEYLPSTKRGKANVAGDVLIEFASDGSTVRKWSVIDILDPERLGAGSLGQGFYEDLYEGRYDPLPYDITHSNALYYVAEEDALIVSSNVQCAIYKVNMQTGELVWLLGDATGWKEPWASKLLKAKGELTWPCHQHGLELTPNGNLLLFDNGGGRNIPPQQPMPADQRYSRAIEYRIDQQAGTIEEVWSYGPKQERFLSGFISDADYLPETGNVLIADGGRITNYENPESKQEQGYRWGRVLEVSHDAEPKKLWEVVVNVPGKHYSIYRAQRFKSLYSKLDRPTG